MFDFDELSGEEEASEAKVDAKEANSQPRLLETMDEPVASEIQVTVSHAIHGWAIRVFLPEKSLFKHVKQAVAKFFEQDSSDFQGQLMHKGGGVYRPYKDKDAVGSVREVLLAGFDGEPPEEGLEIRLGEKDIAEECIASPSSLQDFLILQKELRAGFAEDTFQEELRKLQEQCERGELAKTKFLAERQKLFLTVQSKVLPRYGYEGTSNGVYKMMGDMKPYIKDPQFVELADEINGLLGINYSPSNTWESLSDSCQKLNDEKVISRPRPSDRPRRERGYGELRPPMGLLGPVPSLLNGKPLRLPDFILGNP